MSAKKGGFADAPHILPGSTEFAAFSITVTCRIPSIATDSTLSVMPGKQAYDGTYMR